MPSSGEILTSSEAADLSSNRPQFGHRADPSKEQNEIDRMRAEIDCLHREVSDSRNALLTSNEHGDLLQEHLYRLSTSLTAEIRERQATEEKLQKLLQAITQEKGDLEILVQTLTDQGDNFAEESEKARVDGLTQILNRRVIPELLRKSNSLRSSTIGARGLMNVFLSMSALTIRMT
jgi:predicted ribosome quality control (RQC) complex YloA/Tae2 family protein